MTDEAAVDAVDAATTALERSLLGRALAARDPGRLHLRFSADVLQRYRERGAELVRTRSVGRISVRGRWSLDVGIAANGAEVHLPVQDLLDRLPEEEWPHWVSHLVPTPASASFLQMRMTAGACIDDGDTERWDA